MAWIWCFRLCVTQQGNSKKPRKHEQRLLRNMGVLAVILDLLQIPYDHKEDVRMNELMRLAHQFLQNFCLGNVQNQALLHKHIDLFLTPGVRLWTVLYGRRNMVNYASALAQEVRRATTNIVTSPSTAHTTYWSYNVPMLYIDFPITVVGSADHVCHLPRQRHPLQ